MLHTLDPYQNLGNIQSEFPMRVKLKDRQANFLLCSHGWMDYFYMLNVFIALEHQQSLNMLVLSYY